MKEFLDLAISFAAIEVANTSKVIDGVGSVEAFVIEEGRDKCGKTSTATNAPAGCHLTNEEV
jgi:hypothetical protein